MWFALRRIGDVLDHATDPGDLCRAANAVAALANSYVRLTEVADLEPRLAAVEAALAAEGRP